MAFTLIPSELFLEKVKKLDRSIVIELEKKLEHLRQNPISSEHRMHHSDNYFRVYIRNFRIIYKVDGTNVILFDILRRKEGYGRFGS